MSPSPSGTVGEKTSRPKRTCETTLPPRCDMPWISLFLTSKPASMKVSARISEASRIPCPPTPTSRMLVIFPCILLTLSVDNRIELAQLLADGAAVAQQRIDMGFTLLPVGGRLPLDGRTAETQAGLATGAL